MKTRVYRECGAIQSIASLASSEGRFTGTYCTEANRDIVENHLKFNVPYKHPPHQPPTKL
jgi:hypothetical protein